MTQEEIGNFLLLEREKGVSEIEAYRDLMKVLGLDEIAKTLKKDEENGQDK